MLLKKMLVAGAVLAAATPASTANFTAKSGCGEGHSDKPCTSIYINGKIEPEDGAKWKAFLETIITPHAIVTLNSPGGSGTAGLLIAYDILNREYDTYFNEGICGQGAEERFGQSERAQKVDPESPPRIRIDCGVTRDVDLRMSFAGDGKDLTDPNNIGEQAPT